VKASRMWAASYKGAEYRNVPPMEKKSRAIRVRLKFYQN